MISFSISFYLIPNKSTVCYVTNAIYARNMIVHCLFDLKETKAISKLIMNPFISVFSSRIQIVDVFSFPIILMIRCFKDKT